MLNNSDATATGLVSGYANLKADLVVKDSSIEGKGLFTENELKKGTILFDIVAEKDHHHYDPYLASENPNWIGSGYEEWLMIGPGDIAMYLNHSCHPNVIINEQQQLVAIEHLKAGTELRLDYSTTELDPYWSMECNCDAPECRKILRSFQYLPEALQRKYGQFISPVFTAAAIALQQNQSIPSGPGTGVFAEK